MYGQSIHKNRTIRVIVGSEIKSKPNLSFLHFKSQFCSFVLSYCVTYGSELPTKE